MGNSASQVPTQNRSPDTHTVVINACYFLYFYLWCGVGTTAGSPYPLPRPIVLLILEFNPA